MDQRKEPCGLVVCAWPKYDGVSVISKIVNLVSVSVSVRENQKYINGVVIHIYIYIYSYIYSNNKIVKVNIYIMSYIYINNFSVFKWGVGSQVGVTGVNLIG